LAEDIQKLRERAVEHMAKGRFDKAAEAYAQLCQAEPSDMTLRQRFGDALRQGGRLPEAVRIYEGVAERLAADGQLLKAIAVNKVILEIEPAHASARARQAKLQAQRDGQGKASPFSSTTTSSPAIPASAPPPPAAAHPLPPRAAQPASAGHQPLPPRAVQPGASPPRPAAVALPSPTSSPLSPRVAQPQPSAVPRPPATPPGAVVAIELPDDDEELEIDRPWAAAFPALPTDDVAGEPPLAAPGVAVAPPAPVLMAPPVAAAPPAPVDAFPPVLAAPPAPVDAFPPVLAAPPAPVDAFPPVLAAPPAPVDAFPPVAAAPIAPVAPLAPPVAPAQAPVVAATPMKFPQTPIFSELAPGAFVELLSRCSLRHFDPGAPILNQGEAATSFFVVSTGTVTVRRKGRSGESIDLARLREGAFFGEMALLGGGPRTASVFADGPVDVFEFPADVLRQLMAEHPSVRQAVEKFTRNRLLVNVMATSPLFRPFDAEKRKKLLERFQLGEVVAGQVVVEAGKAGDGLYVIMQGRFQIRVRREGGEPLVLAELQEGDVFGEISVLTGAATTADVVASGPARLLRLPRKVFEELLATHPQIRELVTRLSEERTRTLEATAGGSAPGGASVPW
jgi:CRP-like cAMP-binding protein